MVKTITMRPCKQKIPVLISLPIALLLSGVDDTSLATEVSAEKIWRGVDVSYINELEDCGAVYRVNGQRRDPYTILAEKGANVARLRLLHTPDWTSYNTLADVTRSARRARENNMKIVLAFHYSDDWADPNKQQIPAAWEKAESVEETATLLYDYTYAALVALDKEDLLPDYVQVGNEINSGIAHKNPQLDSWDKNPQRNIRLLNAGIAAVKAVVVAVDRPLKTILHIAQPENIEQWLDNAIKLGLSDFDLIGSSYYSKWSDVPLQNVETLVRKLRNKYNKDIVIVETAYIWTLGYNDNAHNILGADTLVKGYDATQDGQRRYLIDLQRAALNGGGLGITYWEPAWISSSCQTRWGWGPGSHWENAALFDFKNSELHKGADFLSHDFSTTSRNKSEQ